MVISPLQAESPPNEIPSVFAVDAEGIIRTRELAGRTLDQAVERIAKECEARESHAR